MRSTETGRSPPKEGKAISQYREGSVKVTNGSPNVFAIYEIGLGTVTGTISVGDPVVFQGTGASGTVTDSDPGNSLLEFTIETSAQPTLNETILNFPTWSGSVQEFVVNPQFTDNVDPGAVFVVTNAPTTAYRVGSIPNRSKIILTSAYAGDSVTGANYNINTSFTSNYGFPTPEPGDQNPTAIINQALADIDTTILVASGSGVLTLNTLTGAVAISGAGGNTVSTQDTRVIVTGFYDEFVAASGSLQAGIDAVDPDDIEPALLGGVGITVTSGVSTITIDGHLRYTKAENDAIIGQGSVSVISGSNTVTVSGTDFQPFQILDPDEIDYVLDVGAFEAYTIDRAKIKCDTGTALASITIDGIPVEGLDNMSITTALTEYVATSANTVDTGDDVFLSVSGVSTSGTPILGSVRYQ